MFIHATLITSRPTYNNVYCVCDHCRPIIPRYRIRWSYINNEVHIRTVGLRSRPHFAKARRCSKNRLDLHKVFENSNNPPAASIQGLDLMTASLSTSTAYDKPFHILESFQFTYWNHSNTTVVTKFSSAIDKRFQNRGN